MDAASPGPPSPASLPAWYPGWATSLGEAYYAGTSCVFVLCGNIHDLTPRDAAAPQAYCNIPDFLASQVFGMWDIVLGYDLGRGLKPMPGGDAARLQEMVKYLTARLGDLNSIPRDPESVLLLLDRLLERNLLEDDVAKRKSIAILLPYAQYLVPAGDVGGMARGQGANLVRLLSWAQNPYLKKLNVAFVLIAERLPELNERLVQNPHVTTIEVPMPDRTARLAYVQSATSGVNLEDVAEFTAEQLADVSNGLSLVSLNILLSQAKQSGRKLDAARFKQLKKAMIERQCQGLIEFIEPPHTLDLLVGQEAAKKRLADDAALILKGRLDTAPMGYLFCGPVGTGKTFLAECYAGSIGIPCVKLLNFRSKYVGESEANLQQVLGVLRSLGPVVVIIDEADAALGDRSSGGDSGTSSRIFSMIASQMGDTRYRGKIIWMLLTCRPDLLPIDLKRQGRAEVHIPLFYPQDEAELKAMVLAMAKKNKVKLAADAVDVLKPQQNLSGSDIESVVLAAKRLALAAGREEVTRADIEAAFGEFVPSAQGLEKQLQEIAAVLECTQLSFLPKAWREQVEKPGGRAALQHRLVELRREIE